MEEKKPIDFHQYRANVKKKRFENKKFFDNAQRKRPKNIDGLINDLHEEAFENISCLDCGNCCKTTPSLVNNRDVKRISKFLGITNGEFNERYLSVDEDDDIVFRSTPCVFLDKEDNTCSIYEVRPKACVGYPHTDDHKVSLDVMRRNVAICPAVYEITEKMKRHYINELKKK